MTIAANQTHSSGVLRLLALCGAVLLVALAILIYVVSANSSGVAGFERAEGVLFPDLGSQIDNVQSVEINNGRSRFVLTRRDEGWVLEDRDGYPVLEGKIDGLLSALAHARTTYASTKETLNYAEYGLSGINHLAQTATAAATPVTVTLTAIGREHV